MPDPTGRHLVIGLELGDGQLIRDWAAAGDLPTIAGLLDTGTFAWLATPADQLHVSAWPSLYTGTGPGEHGVYFTHQPAPGLQGYRRFYTGLYGRPTFWRLLDQAGHRCAVLDAPYSHPEGGFTGLQVFEWGTWAHYLKPQSTPQRLLHDLEAACGRYPLGLEAHHLGFRPLDPTEIQRRLIAALRAKTEAARWLAAQHAFDLVMCVFGETHVAAHYCWQPEGDQHLLHSLYQEIDRALASLIEAAGDLEASLFLVSGDAIAPNHAGWHLLPEVLSRLGHLVDNSAAMSTPETGAAEPRTDPIRRLRDLLPKDLRKRLAELLPTGLRDRLAQRVDTGNFDWSRTRAYCLPTDLEGCIRINLQGREPQGIVAPGTEYETLCQSLQADLMDLIEPESDHLAVREVLLADQAFPGPRRPHLPDMIVLWNSAVPIRSLSSSLVGVVSGASPDPRPGTHGGPGFALMRGPGIGQGRTVERGHVCDLAPTLLRRFGVEVPSHMTGRPLAESRFSS